MSAREEARKNVEREYGDGDLTAQGASNLTSDVWEPIVKTLRDHVPTRHTIVTTPHSPSIYCGRCNTLWPCPEWRKASEATFDD